MGLAPCVSKRIVQASDTFGQTLGVRLGGIGQGGAQTVWGTTNTNVMANANPTAQQATSFNIADKALDTTGSFVNLPAASLNGFASASFAVPIFNSAKNRFSTWNCQLWRPMAKVRLCPARAW